MYYLPENLYRPIHKAFNPYWRDRDFLTGDEVRAAIEIGVPELSDYEKAEALDRVKGVTGHQMVVSNPGDR